MQQPAGPTAPDPAGRPTPPGPFDANSARPPACQRRRHWYTELIDTRSRDAISATGTFCANHSAARIRTASRLALPWADKPPPSGYLITPA
jgi:hypothetical protein